MDKGMHERHAYHTDVIACGDWTCSGKKGLCGRIEMIVLGGVIVGAIPAIA